jgi:4-amino-4-deoxy-L-arabinose transferase-like glycosyltransferase
MSAPALPRRKDLARSTTARIAYAAVIVAITSLLAFWTALTPPLSTVDEPAHMNSVVRLLQDGGWPPPRSAQFSEGMLVAMREAGNPLGATTPLDELPPPEERSIIVPLSASGLDGANARDWMTQHPPTYYALIAEALRLMGGEGWRWDQLVAGARLLSVLLVTGGVILALAAVRRVSGSAVASVVGVAAILAIPQFFNVLSLVTNDALAVFTGGGIMYFLASALSATTANTRALIRPALGAGLFLGLALLTKGTMITAIPAVFAVFAFVGLSRGRTPLSRFGPPAVSMLVAFVIGGWWWLRNLIVNGELQSSNSGTGRTPEAFDGYSLVEFVQRTSVQLVQTFWGSIRSTLDLPSVLTVSLTLIFAAALVWVLIVSTRRSTVALLSLAPALVVGLIVFHAWEVYWSTGRIVGIQGRYLFPWIAVFSIVIALAWIALFAARSRWPRALGSSTIILLAAVVGVYGAMFAYRARWQEGGWQEMASSGALPVPLIGATAVAAMVAVLVAVVAAGILAMGATAGMPALAARHPDEGPGPT